MDSCTKRFAALSSFNIREDPGVVAIANNFRVVQGHYLYPEINFQCRVKITTFHGSFVVRSLSTLSGFVQLWRNNSTNASIALVVEFPVNFTADYSKCDDSQCILDYDLPSELQIVTQIGDFLGFYILDASLNRPAVYFSEQTELYEYQSNCNQRELPSLSKNASSGFALF